MADAPTPFPLSTSEAVVIDGANSVGGAPRQGFPDAGWGLVVAALAALLAAAALRTRWRPWLGGLLLLAALPGLATLLVRRADAPAGRAALAGSIATSLSALQRVGRWPGDAVRVVHDDDDVLTPLARYAWPTRPALDGGVAVEVRGGALVSACVQGADGPVRCGAPR